MKQDAVLNIEGLTVRAASGDVLVRDVSLTLGAQECLGIAGESGSGKTVTAKSVLQLLPPDLRAEARSLSVLGKDILSMTEPERRRFLGCEVGFVPQNTVAYLDLHGDLLAFHHSARANCHDLCNLGLLLGIACQDNTALGGLLCFNHLDHNSVKQWLNVHFDSSNIVRYECLALFIFKC